MNSLLFLYIVFFISILFEIATVILALMFVLPMQNRQAKVTDRLIKLRKQLLYKGVLALLVAIASALALTIRFVIDGEIYRYIISTLILIHSISTFSKTYIDYRIYHQEYPVIERKKNKKGGV